MNDRRRTTAVCNDMTTRNVVVIAHVDHGKTTLTDSLVKRAGISTLERFTDRVRQDQLDRIITIKATGITMSYPDVGLRLNLIDSPGHVDFSAEVTASLRLTDGALVVVDCVSGVCVQTGTVLRQALVSRVRPVLVINKLDRAFTELGKSAEEVYRMLCGVVAEVNALIHTYQDDAWDADLTLDPRRGNVVFASGKQGWGFTCPQLAAVYAQRLGVDPDRVCNRMWGDWFHLGGGKWTSSAAKAKRAGGATRGFCKLALAPIYRVMDACGFGLGTAGATGCVAPKALAAAVAAWTGSPGARIEAGGDLDESPKRVAARTLAAMMPAADALLYVAKHHLPSPVQAQHDRHSCLVMEAAAAPGAADAKDTVGVVDTSHLLAACDADADLVVFASKMVPVPGTARKLMAFVRVFSGTLRPGDTMHVVPLPGAPASNARATVRSLQRREGTQLVAMDACPAGELCLVSGLDTLVCKACTLTHVDCHLSQPLHALDLSVTPVVRRAVRPRQAAHASKLSAAMRTLSQSDQVVRCTWSARAKEWCIAGAGELHLDICLTDLRAMCGFELRVSEPVVNVRETVTLPERGPACLAKSANRLNRVWVAAETLECATELSAHLAATATPGSIPSVEQVGQWLTTQAGWSRDRVRQVWAVCQPVSEEDEGDGLRDAPLCLLLCEARAVPYLDKVRDTMVAAFRSLVAEGPLSGQAMHGVAFVITDAKVHADSPHRSDAQIRPAMLRAMSAAMRLASPALLEPLFHLSVEVPDTWVPAVYNTVGQSRGGVLETDQVVRPGTPLRRLQGTLPVLSSLGFDARLRGATSGNAFAQLTFGGWAHIAGEDPQVPSTLAGSLVTAARHRAGMGELPDVSTLVDAL